MTCWLEAVGITVLFIALLFALVVLIGWLATKLPDSVSGFCAFLLGLLMIAALVASFHEDLCPKHKPMHVSVSLPLNPPSSTSGGAA